MINQKKYVMQLIPDQIKSKTTILRSSHCDCRDANHCVKLKIIQIDKLKQVQSQKYIIYTITKKNTLVLW